MGKASRRKLDQRILPMASNLPSTSKAPTSSASILGGIGGQVITMGLGAWLGPDVGFWVAIIGLLFFIPLIKEQIETRGWSMFRHWKIFIPIGALIVIIAVTAWHFWPRQQTAFVDPATTVELTKVVPYPELFKPENTAKIDVNFANRGPSLARDVSFVFLLKVRHSSITKQQEDEMFHDLLDNRKGSPETDMNVGNSGFRTVETSMLSKKEADDLQSENARLYLLGYIHYLDKNGSQKYEFCKWLQPPSTWHLCDGGHNRTISENSK